MGSGRVDLAQAGVAGLLLDVTTADFEAADPAGGGVPKELNLSRMNLTVALPIPSSPMRSSRFKE